MKLLPALLPTFCLAISFALPMRAEMPVQVAADNPLVLYSGRRDDSQLGAVRFGYSGACVRLAFEGTAVGLTMSSNKPNWVNIYVDGKRTHKLKVEGENSHYEIASGLGHGIHTVEVIKATEGMTGAVSFNGFTLPQGAKAVPWPKKQTRKIEFVGDSITCGYGIEASDAKEHFTPDTENFCDTYAWLAAKDLDADYLVVARSGIGMLRNYNGPYDGNPDNMPAIYDRTLFAEKNLDWDFSRFSPDVVCINLGTNDFSTKGVNEEKYAANYVEFVRKLFTRYPSARFVLLLGPMQNSSKLKTILTNVADTLNKEHEGKVSVFELSKAGKNGFGADYHPSRAQAKINGAELAGYLSALMKWPLASPKP